MQDAAEFSAVSVVLVNWNNAAATLACLDSLRPLLSQGVQVLVCDNASRDGSAAAIAAHIEQPGLSGVRLLRNPRNGGFAYGTNCGLRMALADPRRQFAWILNNDTQVVPASLEALLACFQQNPHLGLCGSVLVRDDDPLTMQACGAAYNRLLGTTAHRLEGAPTAALAGAGHPLPGHGYLVGASLLASRRLIETIGLLDESYFLYYEDLDWCTRARRAGFALAVATRSIVRHTEGATTGVSSRNPGASPPIRMTRIYYRSCLLYSLKHDRLCHPLVRASMLLRALRALGQGQLGKAWVALYSMLWVWS